MAEIPPRGRKLSQNVCNISGGGHLNDVVFLTLSVNDQTLQYNKKYHEKNILRLLLNPRNG